MEVVGDAQTDHYSLLIKLEGTQIFSNKSQSIWRRNISKMRAVDFETALESEDWSSIYETQDPNTILDKILTNVNFSLDKVAPMQLTKFRSDKARLNL